MYHAPETGFQSASVAGGHSGLLGQTCALALTERPDPATGHQTSAATATAKPSLLLL